MEYTEVVSPSVAVPVLCVLVCAFLVFAFGFKSPAQPPSFDVFDDEAKRKRSKKSKGSKSQTNGHALVGGGDGDGNENSSPKPQASPRQAAKQTTKGQNVSAKSKSAVQSTEQQKKVKKQPQKVEEAKAAKQVVLEAPHDDVDGWQTISKKEKKQKKKENEKVDIAEETSMKVEEGAAKALSDEPLSSAPQPASPQEQRNKKKKEKKNKKQGKSENEVEAVEVAEAAAPVETIAVPEPKVEEVPEPAEDAASSVEVQIKDAMETTVEEAQNNKKKSKNKKKKPSPPPEDDFVIPKAAAEPEVVLTEEALSTSPSLPLTENTDALTVKSAKKKHKKDRNKPIEEVQEEERGAGASDSVNNSSLSQTTVFSPPLSSVKTSDTPESEAGSGEHQASGTESSNVQPQAASFDEMGGMTESWTEAKPKSKKKKARRAD